jgi:hypothetical protein
MLGLVIEREDESVVGIPKKLSAISVIFVHILLCSPLEGLEVGTCVGLDVGADERTGG